MSTNTRFRRLLRPPLIGLWLCGFLAPAAICRGDENDDGAQAAAAVAPAAPVAAPPDAVEPVVVEMAPEKPADEQPAKEPPAVAEAAEANAAEAEPAEQQPVGKLQIRKGTGRPAGLAVVGGGEMLFTEPAALGGLVPNVAAAPVDPEALKQQVEEHRQRLLVELRPLLHRELYFVHLVCDTTAAERKQLLAVGESELTKFAMAAAQRAAQPAPLAAADPFGGAMFIEMPAESVAPEADVTAKIRASLLEAARKALGEQRADRLRQEMQARTTAQRRGPINNIIAQLDAFLVLSPQQQEELDERLLEGWREDWKSISQHIDPRYLPNMHLPPAALMVLSEDQRNRMNAIPRVSFHVHEQPAAVAIGAERDPWKAALDQLDRGEQARGGKR